MIAFYSEVGYNLFDTHEQQQQGVLQGSVISVPFIYR